MMRNYQMYKPSAETFDLTPCDNFKFYKIKVDGKEYYLMQLKQLDKVLYFQKK